MEYQGFGACCAAYAFINTVQADVRPEIYELLSGTPFGIKHRKNDSFRMLTPLAEPCLRVKDTAGALGYHAKHERFEDISEAVKYMSRQTVRCRMMVGPLDMGYLSYLPLNMYYLGQSHYISIEKCWNEIFCIYDSEGILGYECDGYELKKMINTDHIPEAEGKLNIWMFEMMEKKFNSCSYISSILDIATRNLQYAEETGQGSCAISECLGMLKKTEITEVSLRLFYETDYLIQRKNMIYYGIGNYIADPVKEILQKQIHILCDIRKLSLNRKMISDNLFLDLAQYEKKTF